MYLLGGVKILMIPRKPNVISYHFMHRPRLREELHALTYLMEALDFILKEGGGYSQDNQLQYFPALDVSIYTACVFQVFSMSNIRFACP